MNDHARTEVGAIRMRLLDRAVLTSPFVPIQFLPAAGRNLVVRFGEVVYKQVDVSAESLRPTPSPGDVEVVMRRAGSLAPDVVWIDAEQPAMVTRFVNERNWGRLLASGNIDFRTYEKAGHALATLHERLNERAGAGAAPTSVADHLRTDHTDRSVAHELRSTSERLLAGPQALVHGNLTVDNVLLGPGGRMRLTGWRGQRAGDTTWDLASLLADAVVHTITAPHTFDSYVDAGRSLIAGYGSIDDAWLQKLIAALLLTRRDPPGRVHHHARQLLLGEVPLPWTS